MYSEHKDSLYDIHHDSIIILSNVSEMQLPTTALSRYSELFQGWPGTELSFSIWPFDSCISYYVHHNNGQSTETTSHIRNDCLYLEGHFDDTIIHLN